VRAKLLAYFPHQRIDQEWTGLAEAVTAFYSLEGQTEKEQRATLERIASLLHPAPTERSWEAIRQGILRSQAALLQRILQARITGL
jgi:hypothetical protein